MASSKPVSTTTPSSAHSSAHSSPSHRVISAERVVGVQPWTIGGFDATGQTHAADPARMRAEHLPTADDVSAIESHAHDEGYRVGLAEARADTQRLAGLLTGMSTSVALMEREMATSVVKLAIDLARQVVRESIAARPELLLPVIAEAISGLARTADPGGLYVNPSDLALVEQRLGDALAHAGWKAFGDERVEAGGCRLEFAGGQVDASVATRWERVMAQLERPDAWLA